MEKITIVDKNNKIIGSKNRDEITSKDIYRVSSLWVVDKEGNLLVAQRPLWKKNDPGKWTESVVGTNSEGETYESNIIKEAQEELKLKVRESELIPVCVDYFKVRDWRMFGKVFILKLNEIKHQINYNKEEVLQVKWVTDEDVKLMLRNDEFVEGFDKYYQMVIKVIRNA